MSKIEIMAPVGSYESLMAAIQAGADSVYFGVGKLNMRSRSANNFSLDDMQRIADTARQHGVRTYLTVNTIIYDNETKIQEETGTTRYRGNGSLTNEKKPYRIKLDESHRMFKNSEMRSPAKARKWTAVR